MLAASPSDFMLYNSTPDLNIFSQSSSVTMQPVSPATLKHSARALSSPLSAKSQAVWNAKHLVDHSKTNDSTEAEETTVHVDTAKNENTIDKAVENPPCDNDDDDNDDDDDKKINVVQDPESSGDSSDPTKNQGNPVASPRSVSSDDSTSSDTYAPIDFDKVLHNVSCPVSGCNKKFKTTTNREWLKHRVICRRASVSRQSASRKRKRSVSVSSSDKKRRGKQVVIEYISCGARTSRIFVVPRTKVSSQLCKSLRLFNNASYDAPSADEDTKTASARAFLNTLLNNSHPHKRVKRAKNDDDDDDDEMPQRDQTEYEIPSETQIDTSSIAEIVVIAAQ